MSTGSALNRGEWRAAAALAAVLFLRMLGLFMIIPVLSLHAATLHGATPLLIGLALGIYGLTQALCQIPLGALSDRVGRRPVIVGGLALFALGSVLGALAHSIWPVLLGRAVQGAGAISGTTLALASDLSRENQRTKIMALIGISIGIAFSAAFVLGPLLNARLGLTGVFSATAVLAALAIAVVLVAVPRPPPPAAPAPDAPRFAAILAQPELRVLFLGVFALHLVLAASFVAVPIALAEGSALPAARHAEVYLPVIVASLLLVAPFIMLSARPGYTRRLFHGAIAGLVLATLLECLAWRSGAGLATALVLFFTCFNFVEAALPGIVSRAAPAAARGAALGAYSTFQFVGMFAGGVIGGGAAATLGYRGVPAVCAVICALWLALSLRAPATALEQPARD